MAGWHGGKLQRTSITYRYSHLTEQGNKNTQIHRVGANLQSLKKEGKRTVRDENEDRNAIGPKTNYMNLPGSFLWN